MRLDSVVQTLIVNFQGRSSCNLCILNLGTSLGDTLPGIDWWWSNTGHAQLATGGLFHSLFVCILALAENIIVVVIINSYFSLFIAFLSYYIYINRT